MRRISRSIGDPPDEYPHGLPYNQSGPSSVAENGSGKVVKRSHFFSYERRTAVLAYIFLFPSLVGLLAFLLLPVLVVVALSFFDWGLISAPRFIGLQNYVTMVQSPTVQHSVLVTAYFVLLNIPLQTALSLALALFMNKKLAGIGIFRVLYAVPWMATPVVMGIIWQWIFDPQYGALNNFLALFGIHGITWLSSTQWALPSVAAVTIWSSIGYTMLFFLAGLQSIPEYLYEAADIDGASPVRTFFSITLPLLNPTMFFVLVTDVIGSFQLFDTIYAMTKGGPGEATDVLNFYIFRQAFNFFHAGYASALSILLFAILLLVTLLLALFFHNRTTYDLS